MSINLPEPWVGGELAEELPDDPAAMKKALDERFSQFQRNFDALAKGAIGNVAELGDSPFYARRTVRGEIAAAGTVARGDGWTVSKPATGNYDVVFDEAFDDIPVIVATAGGTGSFSVRLSTATPATVNGFRVIGYDPFAANEGVAIKDGVINFIAISV